MTGHTGVNDLTFELRNWQIEDNIREAFGIMLPSNNRWLEIYPCGFTVAFYKGNFKYLGLGCPVDWVDLSDLFVVLATATEDEP